MVAEGKRCLAAGDVASAVENFQDACSLLADQFGQLSKELAEPYYLYGKALLECARMENTVLGSGIPVPEDRCSSDDDDEEGEDDKQETEQHDESISASAPADSTSSELDSDRQATDPQPITGANGTHDSAGTSSGQEGGDKEDDGEGVEGKATEDGEEEETDLKLAWEVLELARVICQKEDSDEYRLKLSDVYFTLGEVALESDQVDQAVGDMNTGLQLKELLLDPSDRRLAEAHFNLGLAYSLQKDHQRSIQEYKCARDTLLKRKEKLVKEMGENEQQEIIEELSDLDALLPDLEAKITDAEENAESKELQETTPVAFGESSEVDTTTITARKTPINDISHLIRKRPADSNSVSGNEQKKIRTEELASTTETTSTGTNSDLTSEQ